MKISKFHIIWIFIFPFIFLEQSTGQTPDVNEIVSKMTLEEKAKLVVGMGMRFPGAPAANEPAVGQTLDKVPGAAGVTYGIPRLGIPMIVMADGPAGLRIAPVRENDTTNTYYATAFPIATLLASSWDTMLVKKVGESIGNEVLEYGVDIILMPALNLHRNPLCGRNFEYYSEDPLLSGSMAAAMVNGIQANGVGTSIKHYVANNQETNRNNINTIVSERALRELYLRGFEIAVKRSNPWTVMSSFNKINGTYVSENYDLLTTVLREEWGFNGFVMTDWFGGKDPVAQMKAGNDLLMPGMRVQTNTIIEAINNGQLDLKILDTNIRRILNVIFRTPAYKNYSYSNKPDLKAHAQIARLMAAEGMVLLKNENNTLPMTGIKRIALFGNASYDLFIGGTGSGNVNEAYRISLEEGLRTAGHIIDDTLKDLYITYLKETKAGLPKPRNPFFPSPPIPEMSLQMDMISDFSENADIALITIGRNSGEFEDRKLEGDYYLNDREKALIDSVSFAFHKKGKMVIVILNIGGVIDVTSWRDRADGILLAWQPGQEGGNSIVDVLSGETNPSGKLPMTFPMTYEDVPSAKNFPGLPVHRPDSVVYEEDIYVGYRHFNTFDVKPAYEFGYGLSYTDFSYKDLRLSSATFNDQLNATITITNTGEVAGKEIVQLYLSAPSQNISKPEGELIAFAKTKLLQPHESQLISFKINARDLSPFDTKRGIWIAEEGIYTIKVGASSLKITHTASFKLTNELVIEK